MRSGGPTYAEVTDEARTGISLEKLGIIDTKVKRAQTSGLLVEIPGEDAGSKADSFTKGLSFQGPEGSDSFSLKSRVSSLQSG